MRWVAAVNPWRSRKLSLTRCPMAREIWSDSITSDTFPPGICSPCHPRGGGAASLDSTVRFELHLVAVGSARGFFRRCAGYRLPAWHVLVDWFLNYHAARAAVVLRAIGTTI